MKIQYHYRPTTSPAFAAHAHSLLIEITYLSSPDSGISSELEGL